MNRLRPVFIITLLLILVSCSATQTKPSDSQAPPQAVPMPQASSAPSAPVLENPPSTVAQPQVASQPAPAPKVETKPVVQKQVKTFSVTAKQFAFDPNVITVNKGDHVILKIKSLDVTHGFALPDFGVNVPLTPGDEKTVEFDATKSGEFGFFCSVVCGSGHKDMTGTLIVQG